MALTTGKVCHEPNIQGSTQATLCTWSRCMKEPPDRELSGMWYDQSHFSGVQAESETLNVEANAYIFQVFSSRVDAWSWESDT